MALPNRLQGWKGIAAFLGVSIRTAQRWAERATDPLPVAVDGASGRVDALQADIEQWDLRRRRARSALRTAPAI